MENKPDLVVSIDFGMTCTGVAFCNVASGSDSVRHIQRWPGRMNANENKVPTLLVYPHGSTTPSSWGFLAETAMERGAIDGESREWFKILLDEQLLEQARKNESDPSKVPSIREVEKWYTDYFQCLYRCIESRLKPELANRWEMSRIEFIFSVPSTWKPNPTVERFRKIILKAGFGMYPGHKAVIGLTEAEAAAVHTARNTPALFKENQVLMVCDVGGGTTDISIFRVKEIGGATGLYKLEQVDVVFGATIGSTQLDNLFEKAVLDRLEMANRSLPMGVDGLDQIAWEMRISKEYQNAKCDYGTEESLSDTEVFTVRIPRLDRSYVNDQYGISGGDMLFQRDSLKSFFDVQIKRLFEMIDKQLLRLQEKLPNEQVAHMVLSGGLGNSAYVRDRLCQRYESGGAGHFNARDLRIRVAPDPQLVVCKGNVVDRVQKLNSGQPVLGLRCCRSSYGMLCKVKYNPSDPAHIGLARAVDPIDGREYVTGWVDWFIKQGEPVSSDIPIVHDFFRKCPPATPKIPDPPRVFPIDIICSDIEGSRLPNVIDPTCRRVCKVYSDFGRVPLSNFKLKNRHWWNTGKKYHRIRFEVKVIMGAADITFELWHQGVELGRGEAIRVEWVPSLPPRPEPSPIGNEFAISSHGNPKWP